MPQEPPWAPHRPAAWKRLAAHAGSWCRRECRGRQKSRCRPWRRHCPARHGPDARTRALTGHPRQALAPPQTPLGRALADRGLLRPPTLQTDETRGSSRLDLFFDLAFVLVVAELAKALREDVSLHKVLVTAGLFTVVW